MKISMIVRFVGIFLLGFVCFALPRTEAQDAAANDCEKLKKDYENLKVDRDNIIAQVKTLLDYRSQNQKLEDDIKRLTEDKKRLEGQLQARLEQNSLLQQANEDLQTTSAQLTQEKETLKNSLEKTEIEYRIIPETRKEIQRLTKENTDLTRKIKQLEDKKRQQEDRELEAYAQAELNRRQSSDFKRRLEEALAKNRDLEKQINQVPPKLAEMARENKVLIKETATMHYNLGVFYTEHKEYSRAAAELEKSIELNPEDPYAHYNLGYIFAEHMVDRPKAIEQFKQFLRLAKTDDKDIDWVKKYILTWQTWEGKKPED